MLDNGGYKQYFSKMITANFGNNTGLIRLSKSEEGNKAVVGLQMYPLLNMGILLPNDRNP